jgi:hypothetical protein
LSAATVLAELEAVTAAMLAAPPDDLDRLQELARRRGRLALQLGPQPKQRLERLLAAGDELERRIRKTMAVLEAEIARTEREDRFARELRATVPNAPGLLNLRA